jgi:hypothetical protein
MGHMKHSPRNQLILKASALQATLTRRGYLLKPMVVNGRRIPLGIVKAR